MNNKIFKFFIFIVLFLSTLPVIPIKGVEQFSGECSWIQNYLTPVADFPQPGVKFQWYVNLFKDPKAFCSIIQTFAKRYKDSNLDAIVALESRGFIFGAALAYELKVPFVMIRKPGKLPRAVERVDFSMEYGKTSFEIEIDSLVSGNRVLIIDDVLATGGTACAAKVLVERLGGKVVEAAFMMELSSLHGREKLGVPVYSLIVIEEK